VGAVAPRHRLSHAVPHRRQGALFVKGGFAATRRSAYDDLQVRAAFRYYDELRTAVENAEPRPEAPLDAALNCRPTPS
jgi:hypothetical protein